MAGIGGTIVRTVGQHHQTSPLADGMSSNTLLKRLRLYSINGDKIIVSNNPSVSP
ncbi:hypothetical protein COLO4_28192 [Corchorus olitorius]|uniref:Uncharacterized protein n=1 Tax=Corchorus olitorius TaxID=93759 RepID=A0A1R3HMN5_9ROSI|nr:hypothetical protein COLO4_28192 [Corchorus olitorius]